jgi:hypothetical protein
MNCRHLAVASVSVALMSCATFQRPAPNAGRPEISVTLPAPPDCIAARVHAAFVAHQLPVSTSQPGVIESRLPLLRGLQGYYDLFARAVIIPSDSMTSVTLYGEETLYPADGPRTAGETTRIGPRSQGRAGEVWAKLQTVAKELQGDATLVRR